MSLGLDFETSNSHWYVTIMCFINQLLSTTSLPAPPLCGNRLSLSDGCLMLIPTGWPGATILIKFVVNRQKVIIFTTSVYSFLYLPCLCLKFNMSRMTCVMSQTAILKVAAGAVGIKEATPWRSLLLTRNCLYICVYVCMKTWQAFQKGKKLRASPGKNSMLAWREGPLFYCLGKEADAMTVKDVYSMWWFTKLYTQHSVRLK